MTRSGSHIKTGKAGESLAENFLKKLGYSIITKNYRKPWGEIDIIAKSPNKTLTFVEVKTIISLNNNPAILAKLSPEDNLSQEKLFKLKKICEEFANNNPNLVKENRGWQIDLIAINLPQDFILTEKNNNCIIKHYQNI